MMGNVPMRIGTLAAVVLLYGFALWLGLYLIRRDPQSARMRDTGLGLVAYACALACGALADTATHHTTVLTRLRWPLVLLPALCWTGALIHLLPEDLPARGRLVRGWAFALPLVAGALLLLSLLTPIFADGQRAAPLVVDAIILLPMLALVARIGQAARGRAREMVGVLAVVTLFFTLSMGLLLVPLSGLPRLWAALLVGVDIVGLGLVIARFDAFDQGEALLPDMLRSFDAALLSALVFGGQVALVAALTTGPTASLLALLLAVIATAIALPTFADSLGALLDRAALGRLPQVRTARAELRAEVAALPRANPALDPATLDEAEFARLTRRALSHFGDLPRLSASPLTQLPLITRRLCDRNAPDDALERAAELKAALAESVARLKPRVGGDFGTSDEWRHYNALHWPYIVGLKPYSLRADSRPADPAARDALEWLRSSVPERTLYNWQNAAAKLVAHDLHTRETAVSH